MKGTTNLENAVTGREAQTPRNILHEALAQEEKRGFEAVMVCCITKDGNSMAIASNCDPRDLTMMAFTAQGHVRARIEEGL